MPKRILLRQLTTEQTAEIRRLAASHTKPLRQAQRVQIIAALLDGPKLTASAASLRSDYPIRSREY